MCMLGNIIYIKLKNLGVTKFAGSASLNKNKTTILIAFFLIVSISYMYYVCMIVPLILYPMEKKEQNKLKRIFLAIKSLLEICCKK